MKKAFSLLVLMLSLQLSWGQATVWKADPMHSKLTFTVTHMGISSIFGLFQKFETQVSATQSDFSDAVFTLSVDVASVNTEVKMRDDDLRSPNFFDVGKYPTMTFRSTRIQNTTGMKDQFRITGDLTMHGVTKSVTMDLWFRGTRQDAKSGKKRAGFQLWGSIDRSDFNIGPASPFDISTEVAIKADGEFLEQ